MNSQNQNASFTKSVKNVLRKVAVLPFFLASLVLINCCSKAPSNETKTLSNEPKAPRNATGSITRDSAVTENAGKIVTQTLGANVGTVYVFEENHASLRGQIQIATMLTRLYKRDGMRVVGLEGSPKGSTPLPTKTFLQGNDLNARRDALRRMLADGEIRGTEYVASVNPSVELWGLEREAEYNVQPPSGISPSFQAILLIAQKLLTDDQVETFVNLAKAKKTEEAIQTLKDANPWISHQLSITNDDNTKLSDLIANENAILDKAKEVGVDLPQDIKVGMRQSVHFYEVAETRSITIASNMVLLATANAGAPAALVVGAAHADAVMNFLSKENVTTVLIKPLNLDPDDNDLGVAAFENKNNGLLANDTPNSFGFFLNQWFNHKRGESLQHPPPTFIGNPNPSRDALGSLQYATSVLAEAVRAGRRLPEDTSEVFKPLPGGVSIDQNSIQKDGYDVVFCAELTMPNNLKRRIWVRAGTVAQRTSKHPNDEKEKDLEVLAGADGEPPNEPPHNDTHSEQAENSDDAKKSDSTGNRESKIDHELLQMVDVAVECKAFDNEAQAKACPHMSTE